MKSTHEFSLITQLTLADRALLACCCSSVSADGAGGLVAIAHNASFQRCCELHFSRYSNAQIPIKFQCLTS